MRHVRAAAMIVGALLLPGFAHAGQHLFDLATHPGGEVKQTVAPGRIQVVVFHRLPGRQYSVELVRTNIPQAPLPLPSGINIPAGAAADPECLKLKAAFDAIGTPSDEAAVGEAATAIAAMLRTSNCQGPVRKGVEDALAKYDNRLAQPEYDLAMGQELRITVTRLSPNGAPEKTWTTVLTTGPRGEWMTTYGLSFVAIRDDLFFTKAGENEGEFVITKQRKDATSAIKYLPSVLFSWMPASRQNKDLAISPTAGFAISNDTFGVLGGATVTYNANLGFTAGVAVSRQRRLIGSFEENQVVKENLTEDALHHNVLKAAAFVAVTFRFGSNPFKSGDDEKAAEEKKGEATPAKTPGGGK